MASGSGTDARREEAGGEKEQAAGGGVEIERHGFGEAGARLEAEWRQGLLR